MRGKTADTVYLEPEIMKILDESDNPISALGINFMVNDRLDRIVELNTIKKHLDKLVKNKKVLEKTKDDTTCYKVNTRNKSN